MASEIRVNKIENRSGLGTVTFADTGVDLAGIVTATTFSGSGASLTDLPAGNVTGTLPAISGANLTNLPAANITGTLPAISATNLTNIPAPNVVGVHTSLTVTNATTTGTAVVGGGVTISESGIEASGIGITVANINGAAIGGRRNMIINGDMRIAQRGTSSTSAGYYTVDRFKNGFGGTDEAVTQEQIALSSSSTGPWEEGFKYSYRLQNGNQTGGAGTSDYVEIQYKIEAQDMRDSGWLYTSPTSFMTLSFWVMSDISQNYYGFVYSADGTAQRFIFETGTLTANVWKKVVVKIPGNSNIQFDDNVNEGLIIKWVPFYGTDLTNNSGTTLGAWANYNGAARTPDYTTSWYINNDARFSLTGVQLELGEQATPFEHRTKTETLQACKRYYQNWNDWQALANKTADSNYDGHVIVAMVEINMRANPTVKDSSGSGYKVYGRLAGGSGWTDGSNGEAGAVHHDSSDTHPGRWFKVTGSYNWHSGYDDTIAVKFQDVVFDAELQEVIMSYKLLKEYYADGTSITRDCVIRLSDHAQIPYDDNNTDYIEYKEWLDAGNTPAAAD